MFALTRHTPPVAALCPNPGENHPRIIVSTTATFVRMEDALSDTGGRGGHDRAWPYAAAMSTGLSAGSAGTLLCAVLAAGRLDEISTADGAVENYILHAGHVDGGGRLQSGVIFWVYPTGGKGPYEDLDDGTILKHGLLLTIERGALVEEVLREAEAALPQAGIAHIHLGRTD